MVIDKRDECGCHRECITLPHICDNECIWPVCLDDDEHEDLMRSITRDDF